MSTESQDAPQGGGESKIERAYKASLANVVALFGGPTALKPPKIEAGSTAGIIEELISEERKQIEKDFKDAAKQLLKDKVEFDKFIKAKQAELQKVIEAKKKEFTVKANKVVGLINGIDTIRESYAASLIAETES